MTDRKTKVKKPSYVVERDTYEWRVRWSRSELGICYCFSADSARKIARALNAMKESK